VTAPDTLVASIKGDAIGLQYACDVNPHEALFNSEGYVAFPFMIGTGRTIKQPADAPQLLKIEGDPGKASLHVAHVRREGYVFQVVEGRGATGGNVTVKAYIPKEWKSVEIRQGDRPIEQPKIETDSGRQYIKVHAQINGDRLIIAEEGHVKELAKVNRF
jgi:hypothetical protein